MVSGTDNASYSVATTYDTVPMADQNGEVSVTLTNTGTSTWTGTQPCAVYGCYGLGARVYASSDTTGTGTPLTVGPVVTLDGSVAPGASWQVEGIMPAELPGGYTLCWSMVSSSGVYFSDEGADEYCQTYDITLNAPEVDEQEPLPGTDVDTQSPMLSASATIPGGYPASQVLSYAFQIVTPSSLPVSASTTWTVAQSSGWVADNGNSWTPPKPLAWGGTYYWQVVASPPPLLALCSCMPWTTPISFTVGNAQPAIGHQLGNMYQADDGNPVMTSDLGGAGYQGSGQTVDPRTANVSQQVTDASVATAGPPLEVTRTYNSLDPRTSQALGAGWSSVLDMSLDPENPDGTGALFLTLADGQQVRFAPNSSGGYAPPQDLYAAVSPVPGGGFKVIDQTGTTYRFTQASGADWLISAITDSAGLAEAFTYNSGTLTTITSSVSGRALHFTWTTATSTTSAHVATVTTDPVTPGDTSTALTWTYSYNGDLLTSVCPPGTTSACTKYSYTTGAHAATAVLNASPVDYWRLNDPAGTKVAASKVPVNELSTVDPPAAEFNTIPGQAGILDTGATATGFNGTSSWIVLDGAWCTTPGTVSSCSTVPGSRFLAGGSEPEPLASSLAISLWFKTTSSSQVLLDLSAKLPTTCTGSACGSWPLLWIQSNGSLDGFEGLVSPASVTDGAWHQAVLIPGQALYLDGKLVATNSYPLASGSYVVLGAGVLSQGGPVTYFNGSMADVSVYQDNLPGSLTVAAQHAAETTPAAELSQVTSPGGRTEMSATYDVPDDRVATLTDAHGGTWAYGQPVDDSSSAAYNDAVMGSAPEDFWPLNDATGLQPHDLVGSSATTAAPRPLASYTDVTLGVPGPTGFADGTAAGFSGNGGNFVFMAGPYFAGGGSGEQSVELWFKTTKTSEQLVSSQYGSAGAPVALSVGSSTNDTVIASVGGTQFQTSASNFVHVSDGNWHQVVLTLGSTSAAVLYLDGQQIATKQLGSFTAGTGYSIFVGGGPAGSFAGSIADVSLYTSPLTGTEVIGHYAALQNQLKAAANAGGATLPAYPNLDTQTVTVTDPVSKTATYVYASGNLIKTIDVRGGTTWYGYDEANRASTITDQDGDTTYTTHDANNNVTSTTTCADVNDCQTAYTSYYEDLANPLNPLNNKPTDDRDGRSSSPSDPTYDTLTAYTTGSEPGPDGGTEPAGLVASRTTPPTAACPRGCKTTYTYTTGSEPAVGSTGTEPAGLVASITAPGAGVTSYAYDSAGDVAKVTDPLRLVTKYTYDNLGRQLTQTQLSDTYPAPGLTTSYVYDSQSRITQETDPEITDRVAGAKHTKVTSYTYDPDDDVLTTTVSDATGGDPSRTTTNTYDAYGNLASVKDPLGNTTTYSYDAFGHRVTQTNPANVTTTYTYDAAGELLTTTLDGYTGNPSNPIPAENLVQDSRSYDPAGRVASDINVNGTTTDYTYYGNNQLASSYVVCPTCSNGMQDVHTYSYDAAGNRTSETAPGGLVVNTAYDPGNQVTSQVTDPAGADRTVSLGYDTDGNVVAESLTGGGVTQTQTMTYNAMDQELSQTVNLGRSGGPAAWYPLTQTSGTAVPDSVTSGQSATASGVTWTDSSASLTGTYGQQIATGGPVVDTTGSFTVSAWVDLAGDTTANQTVVAQAAGTDSGFYLKYYPGTGGWEFTRPLTDTTDPANWASADSGSAASTGTWTFLTGTYDANTRQVMLYVNGSSSGSKSGTDSTPFASNGPLMIGQAKYDGGAANTFDGQIADVQVYPRALPASEVSMLYGMGRGGGDVTTGNLTTTYQRDQRGLVTAETDPAGNTTTIQNDEDGRAVVTTAPPVPSQTGTGAAPTTAYPIAMTGYDTFGDTTEVSDADNNVTKYAYDQDGHQVSITGPSYKPPGAAGPVNTTTTMSYNSLGLETGETDPLGNTTSYSYDQLGDKTTETDPGGETWTYTYDPAGEQTSVTDPTGAQTQATYDNLGRLATTTDLVRQNSSAAYTTSYAYDDAGDQISQTTPTEVTTKAAYNAVGEEVSSTDGAGNTTTYGYDLNGHQVKQTLPDGTATTATYDLAGRQTSMSDLDASGNVLRTQTAGYNPDGQVTAATDGNGNTTTYTYDATGMLTSATQPVSASQSITVGHGYDLAGNQTAVTDGNGNTTYTTYNPLGLAETITEPPTAQYTSAADSQTTDIYDGDGNLVTQDLPGGAQVTNTYDPNGDLTGQSGSGASAPTATRSFTYDTAGRLLTAATSAVGTQGTFGYQPATSESFGYDDRGLLLFAAGSAGTSGFSYNSAGQLATAADAAGTSVYTYNSAGRLATDTDAASGTTGAYSYNTLGQVTSITYGTGNDIQSYGYDSLHRLTSDTVSTGSGATVASIGYGYDANNNVTSMTTTGLATAGGTGTVTNSYGYDQANRLTSWTAIPSGGTATTSTYGYDNNGNLVNNNGATQTYDARNELTSDSYGNSYTYAADGDLTQQNSPGNNVYYMTSDAYGQQITDGFSSFAWDALNRVISAGQAFNTSYNVTLTYDGATNQVASDPSATYSRDPAGQITGVNTAGGKTIALDDGHNDLSGTFTAAGTTLTGSTTWDPWGQKLASTGPAVQVGYQGQWTDPVSGQVSMGSRMYRPPVGGFINQDTSTGGDGATAVTDNLHAYVNDNPMSLTDPTGHSPSGGSGGGSITAGQVAAAAGRALEAHAKAAAAETAAAGAATAAAAAREAAHGAAALARMLNSAAARMAALAARAAQLAAAAFRLATAMLKQAESWQAKADAAWESVRQHLDASHGWNPFSDAANLYDAGKETAIALYDEARAAIALIAWGVLTEAALGLQLAADAAKTAAGLAALAAKGAAKAAELAAKFADAAERTAQAMAAYAAQEEALAAHLSAVAAALAAAYARQMAAKARALARAAVRVLKKVAKKVAHAAVAVAKAAYKISGAQDIVSCVTDPSLGSCVQAALTVALTIGTDGLGGIAEHAALDVAENAGEHIAEDAGENALKDAAESCLIGGASFSPGTKVLLASGAAIPISQLRVGDKVQATNTKTGKTQPETVTAVLVHHDTDLYDLKVRANGKTAVIDTTSNHLFWIPATRGHSGRWVKAGALRYGTHLRTPSGADTATFLGGWIPRQSSGWMWDLTVPGNNDHDFYIDTIAASILVHNCTPMSQMERVGSGLKSDVGHRAAAWVVDNPAAQRFTITGGDGVVRDLYQLPGEMTSKRGTFQGIFEWIVDNSGDNPVITHQRFIRGGSVTGFPNQ